MFEMFVHMEGILLKYAKIIMFIIVDLSLVLQMEISSEEDEDEDEVVVVVSKFALLFGMGEGAGGIIITCTAQPLLSELLGIDFMFG